MKLFLNLSKEEQRTRFLKRIDVPERNWKFSAADVRERRRWDDYQHAFSEMLSATSTEARPVVRRSRPTASGSPASAPAAVLAHTLIEIDPQFPTVGADARARPRRRPARNSRPRRPKGAAADPFAAGARRTPAHGTGKQGERQAGARRSGAAATTA